jgi:hypothetical protein
VGLLEEWLSKASGMEEEPGRGVASEWEMWMRVMSLFGEDQVLCGKINCDFFWSGAKASDIWERTIWLFAEIVAQFCLRKPTCDHLSFTKSEIR